MKKHFTGDLLLSLAVMLVAIACMISTYRVNLLEKDIKQLEGRIDEISAVQAETKRTMENIASDTDAQYESITQKLDEYQGDLDNLGKTVDSLIPEEPSDEEIQIEVNDTVNETKAEPVTQEDKAEPVETEESEETTTEAVVTDSDGNYIGTFQLTAYCATGNPCADGAYPQVGYTAACNDSRLWHRWIYIEGYGNYYVHDTGGMPSNVIDLFVGSYDEAIQFGRRSANVYFCD